MSPDTFLGGYRPHRKLEGILHRWLRAAFPAPPANFLGPVLPPQNQPTQACGSRYFLSTHNQDLCSPSVIPSFSQPFNHPFAPPSIHSFLHHSLIHSIIHSSLIHPSILSSTLPGADDSAALPQRDYRCTERLQYLPGKCIASPPRSARQLGRPWTRRQSTQASPGASLSTFVRYTAPELLYWC